MDKLKFLHVGCGPKRKDNTTKVFNSDLWEEVTLDIDPNANPDIISSMTDLSMIKDESFDAIYSSHNIEHLYIHEAITAVKGFNRILKKNGYVMIVCPDLISTCEALLEKGSLEPLYYIKNAKTKQLDKNLYVSAIDILYGWRNELQKGNYYMAHKSGYTEKSLTALFIQNSFKFVAATSRKEYYDINLIAFKSEQKADFAENLLREHLS